MLDEVLTAEERAVVARARAFAEEQVAPNAARWEWDRRYPLETIRAACAAGLNTIELAKKHGGQGLSFSCKLRAFEEIARHDFAFAFALINHHNAVARFARDGQPAHVARLLPRMIAGEVIGCAGLSEPGCRQRLRRPGNVGGEGRGWLEAERRQGVDHQRRRRRPLGGLCPDRSNAGLSRHRLLRHRGRPAGLPARRAVRAAWRPRHRRRRLPPGRLRGTGRGGAASAGAGLQGGAGRHQRCARLRRRHVLRHAAGLAGDRGALYAAAQDLRPARARPSGRALEAGRRRDRSRGRAAARPIARRA